MPFARFYEMILEEIGSLPLDDAAKLASFAEMAKRILQGSDDLDAIGTILHEWSDKITVAGYADDVFGLCAFLEELRAKVVQKNSTHTQTE